MSTVSLKIRQCIIIMEFFTCTSTVHVAIETCVPFGWKQSFVILTKRKKVYGTFYLIICIFNDILHLNIFRSDINMSNRIEIDKVPTLFNGLKIET